MTKKEIINQRAKKHYAKVKDDVFFRLTSLRHDILNRCYNKTDKRYANYGFRGITVCDLWKDDKYEFINWALNNGYKKGLSIERIDNNDGYNPENCKFATRKEQNNNRRTNVFIDHGGLKKTLAQWSEFYGIPKATLWWRYKRGYPNEIIFNTNNLQTKKPLTNEPNELIKEYKMKLKEVLV